MPSFISLCFACRSPASRPTCLGDPAKPVTEPAASVRDINPDLVTSADEFPSVIRPNPKKHFNADAWERQQQCFPDYRVVCANRQIDASGTELVGELEIRDIRGITPGEAHLGAFDIGAFNQPDGNPCVDQMGCVGRAPSKVCLQSSHDGRACSGHGKDCFHYPVRPVALLSADLEPTSTRERLNDPFGVASEELDRYVDSQMRGNDLVVDIGFQARESQGGLEVSFDDLLNSIWCGQAFTEEVEANGKAVPLQPRDCRHGIAKRGARHVALGRMEGSSLAPPGSTNYFLKGFAGCKRVEGSPTDPSHRSPV